MANVAFAFSVGNLQMTNNVTTATTSDATKFNITITDNPTGEDVTYIVINTSLFSSGVGVTNLFCGWGFTNSSTYSADASTIVNCSNVTGHRSFLNTSAGPAWLNITYSQVAPSTPNVTAWQYALNVTVGNSTGGGQSNYTEIIVNDNDVPVVYYYSPSTFTPGQVYPGAAGTSMSSTVSFVYGVTDNSNNYGACYVYGNFTGGSGAFARNASNTSVVLGSYQQNTISVTMADGTYVWNINCSDAAGYTAFNATNRTLYVDAHTPIITYAATNNTDIFYSNCTGNKIINISVNANNETGLGVNATVYNTSGLLFSDNDVSLATGALAGSATKAMYYSQGYYRANFTISAIGSGFVGTPIFITASDGLNTNNSVNLTGSTPVIYDMTVPTGLGGATSNFCYLADFGNISNLTFEKVGLGKILFTQNVNMSTQSQGEKLQQLSTAMDIVNKTIYLNSTYFSELNLTANLTMYNLLFMGIPNLTYSAQGSTDVNACPTSLCGNMSWTNSTTGVIGGNLTFQVSHFTNYTADGDAPTISASSPSGTQTSGTVIIAVTTNEKAHCKYDTTNVAYSSMGTDFSSTDSTSHTATLSLTNGAYIYYVLCADVTNNTMTTATAISFSVAITTTTSGGGGGGSSSAGGEPTETQTLSGVQAGSIGTVTLTNTQLAVSSMEITAASAIQNGQLTVTQSSSLPASVSSAVGETVYKYVTISESGIATDSVKSAKVRFKVAKSWLTDNNFKAADMVLSRYSGGAWTELTTRQTNEDSNYNYYEADSPGLSVYAIKIKTAAAGTTTGGTETNETVTGGGNETSGGTGGAGGTTTTPGYVTTIIIVAVLAIAAGGIWLYINRAKEIGRLPWRKNVGFKSADKQGKKPFKYVG